MDLFKASLPSIEDYAKQLVIRKNLTDELKRSIRLLQEENLGKSVIADTDECANALCSVIEAIFIHGLKDKLSTKVTSVFGSSNDKMPEPEFWTFVSKYCHKNVIMEIKNLTQISSDIGRCRAWLRIALNDGLILSFLGTILSDKPSLQKFYYTTAYLRDEEQSDIMRQLLEGTAVFHFELSCNNSVLNSWHSVPLTLANIWIPPVTPQPVMPAVDVIDFFTEQKHQKKSSSKGDSPSVKNKVPSTPKLGETDSGAETPHDKESMSPFDNQSKSVPDGEFAVGVKCEKEDLKDGENASKEHSSDKDAAKFNEICITINKSENVENEDTSSKISSSDSVPDFGIDAADDSQEIPYGSFGNKLHEKSGWSSVFDDERDQRDNEASQSYDSLLQSYNKNLSKVVIGTPELADTFSSIMGKSDEFIVINCFVYFNFLIY